MLPASRAEPRVQGGGGREAVDAQSSYTADTPWHKLEQFQGCCNLQQVPVVLGTELSPVQTEPPHISTRVLLLKGLGRGRDGARCCQQVKAIKLSLKSALGSLCWSCTKQFRRTCSWMTEKSRPPQTSSTRSSIERSNLLTSSSTQCGDGVCVHTCVWLNNPQIR